MAFPVSVKARSVRPWKAWSKVTAAGRPVNERASLIAFSTASAPELTSMVRFWWSPGVSSFNRSARATYGSFSVTWKHVCVYAAACSRIASTTAGWALPPFRTASPAPKSISRFPSTSSTIAPEARSTNTGTVLNTAFGIAALRRAISSRERGPGMSVTRRRSWGSSMGSIFQSAAPDSRRARSKRSSAVCTVRPTEVAVRLGSPLALYGTYNPVVTVLIEDILRIPGLALKLVAGRAGASRPIRWVHVSELEDPTPWLRGGELILTTGMGLGKSPARQRAYLERLATAKLSGLGFGVGFSYSKVPKAVVDAADRLRFPVFEVPYPVPFIAITEAVFTRLGAEQFDVLQRSLEAQKGLTRVVLEGEGLAGLLG